MDKGDKVLKKVAILPAEALGNLKRLPVLHLYTFRTLHADVPFGTLNPTSKDCRYVFSHRQSFESFSLLWSEETL